MQRMITGCLAMVIAVAVSASSCAGLGEQNRADQSASDRGLRPIPEAELRILLSSHYLELVNDTGEPTRHSVSEFFCENDSWRQTGTRVPRYGQYSLSGNELCVEPNGAGRFCRRISTDGARYFSQSSQDESASAARVYFWPMSAERGCS